MDFYLKGRILYFLIELQKKENLSLNCENVRPYLDLVGLLLKEELIKVIKYGYYLEFCRCFPLIVKVSEKGEKLLKEELGEFENG